MGGKIEFSKDTPTIGYFDCIWVVKALPGYSGIFLRLMKKRIIDSKFILNLNILRTQAYMKVFMTTGTLTVIYHLFTFVMKHSYR